jgi:hypothetical protein
MTIHHPEFEWLCARAANDDLDRVEHAQLRDHLDGCPSCRVYLLQMRRLEMLLLVQTMKKPVKSPPAGLQERFLARAKQEGIPLTSPRIGFPALGTAAALLIVLLLASAALKTGLFTRGPAETGTTAQETAQTDPNFKAIPRESAADHLSQIEAQPFTKKVSQRRVRVQSIPQVHWSALEGRRFHFTLFAQNSSTTAYSFLSAGSSPRNFREPDLAFDPTSEVFRHIEPSLLASGPTGSYSLRSNLEIGAPTGRSFRLLKVDFTADGYGRLELPGDTQ